MLSNLEETPHGAISPRTTKNENNVLENEKTIDIFRSYYSPQLKNEFLEGLFGGSMKRIVFPAFLILCLAVAAFGQEFRATISGRVTDTTGAVVPGTQINVTNLDTGVKTPTTVNADGQYTIPFLQPGKYSVSATQAGFQSYTRSGITLQSGDKIAIDISLQVGAATTQVNVSADATLLQTQSSTAGQVLTPEEVENLPANGRSPLGLAKTEYAVVPKQKNSVVQARPFDNSAASDFSVGGGASQSNEYLLNGIPNMQNSSRLPGFSPLQDAVSEIRVDAFQADASYGDTSNGTINLITKSGGNRFHGTLSEFNQFSAINAPVRWFQPVGTKQPATHQNQYGGTIGGPIWIPKVVNGRDKLFFFYAYEAFKGAQPNPTTTTVPTAAERNGDFSALFAAKGPSYQLYNPYNAKIVQITPNKPTVVRQPIPNNVLANAGLKINPIAQAYLQYFPLPNVPGNVDGSANYSTVAPQIFDYNSHQGRIDYSINDSNKLFFETHRSEYVNTTGQVFPNIATGARSYTVHQGGVVDFVHTFSPKYTLDTRVGLTRTYSNSTLLNSGFDPTSLGFPGYLNQTGSPQSMPVITFTDPGLQSISANPGAQTAFDTIALFSALTAAEGKHTLKLGIDFRQNKNNVINVGNSSNLIVNGQNVTSGATSGSFGFGTNWLSQGPSFAAPPFGGSYASFLLGLPTTGSFNINPKATYNSWYFAGFIQDDWRVARNLTVNAGLRFESETSINESNNKASWFDPTAANTAGPFAAAAYAKNPIPELPASAFAANGGLAFASSSGRRVEYFTPAVYVSPRIGLAYTPEAFKQKLVVHAGYGLLYSPFNDYYTPQNYGFSSTIAYAPTNDGYLTPATNLSNPFPASNPIVQPTGSSLGANTYLGQSISIRAPQVKGPYVQRWTLDFQYQLTPNTMFQVGYIGAHGVNSSYTNLLSAVGQLPFLSRLPGFDRDTQNNLVSTLANPFKGAPGETGTLATADTLTKFTMLQTLPQYSSVSQQLVSGGSLLFHELAVRIQKRTSHGLTINFNYQWSHNITTSQLNNGGALFYGGNASDFPTHVSLAGTYLLPFGKNQHFFGSTNPVVNALIGGFTINGIYTYLSGAMLQWGGPGGNGAPYFANGTQYDSRLKIRPRNYNAALDTSLFALAGLQPTQYNLRTFPLFYGRQDGTNILNASILKDFSFGERVKLQYRFEAYNALNRNEFGAPNVTPNSSSLGKINSTVGLPRVLQQGLRLVF